MRPAEVGKSWLACALDHKACREDFAVAYHRAPRLFAALALAKGDGRYARLLKALARTDLLIPDDWGPEKLSDDQRRDLLEIVEDRYERRSTIVAVGSPSTVGTKSSAIQPSPTPSSIASSITAIASS